MGITALTLADGRVQLLHTFSNVKQSFFVFINILSILKHFTYYNLINLQNKSIYIYFIGKNTAGF